MIPACLIVGDSTGVGTAAALAAQGIHCEVRARVGASSSGVLRLQQTVAAADAIIVAVGSNDPANPQLRRSLHILRSRLRSRSVTWVAPYHPRAASIVASVAITFGDKVVPLSRYASRDRVHPISYRQVAADLHPFRQSVAGSTLAPAAGVAPQANRRAVVLSF